jgi:hypothetical protein
MRNLLLIIGVVPMLALSFLGCEKNSGNDVIHDTVYVEFDQFTYSATGENENGDLIIFSDPNYGDSARYELFLYNWRYFNDIKVDYHIFAAVTQGISIKLYINGELLGSSITQEDEDGFQFQYLEIAYNTGKKSDHHFEKLVECYKAEMRHREQ